MNPQDIEATHTDLPTDVNPSTTEDIRTTIRQNESGKAAGPDSIPAEAPKSVIEQEGPNYDVTDRRRTLN
ncbi:unnamed protein product [Schistosoma margrebowiei]|uniref:Uncharacterized protein n=1 Tax=Schistosoma margrebowiei TaxID=48269 RepID=A0A183LBA6_9TREM|nr:unnamed protein product [Schistosoma margrebowiei]